MSVASLSSREIRTGLHWPRLALFALLAWWTLGLGSGRSTWCFLDFVNLAFHEAGHVFLTPFGSTVHYLGGTIGQLAVPAALVVYFLIRQRKPFAAAVCLWWIGQNLINISIYMADARSLALPLVGGGDHDWNELFFRFGTLTEPAVNRIANATHVAGVVIMLLGLAWSLYFALPVDRRERVRSALTSHYPQVDFLLEP